MNRMTRFTMLAAAMLIAFAPMSDVVAQRGPVGRAGGMGFGSERQIANIAETLALSETQQEQVALVFAAHRQAALDWREANPSATREERMTFFTAHRAGIHAAIAEILDESQREKLDEVFPATPPARGTMRGGNRGNRGPQSGGLMGPRRGTNDIGARGRAWNDGMLSQRLGLSDEQMQEVRAMRLDHRIETLSWLRDNPDATAADREAYLQQRRTEHQKALMGLLTPQQAETLDSLRHTRPERRARGRVGNRGGR